MESSFRGKIAWVTGASGGMGSAITKAFHDAGCTVLSTDLSETPGFIGDRVVHRRCDVTRQEDVDATVAFARDNLGGLDILANNAGINRRDDIFDLTREVWRQIFQVNLEAYMFCAQAAARVMRDQGRGGAIVNTGSIGADRASANAIPYYTSKGGVRTLTYALAVALAPYDIRVNGVAPGPILTPLTKRFNDPQIRANTEKHIPQGRLGVPADVAPAVVFLASEAAGHITGSMLRIDGGRTVFLE